MPRENESCNAASVVAASFVNRRRQIVWFLMVVICIRFTPQLCAGTKRLPAVHSVDLNSANAEELQQVPGIGASTAKAIVNFRQKSGPFQKIDDLLAIKGISKARLEKMRPYLTIGPSPRKSP
jgi:comEA protein